MCYEEGDLVYQELYELGCNDIEDYVELKCMEQHDPMEDVGISDKSLGVRYGYLT